MINKYIIAQTKFNRRKILEITATAINKNTDHKKMRRVFCLFLLFNILNFPQEKKSLSVKGELTNSSNGEPVAACVIIVSPINKTVYSDDNGNFQISLLPGVYQFHFRHLAFEKVTQELDINSGVVPEFWEVKLKPVILESSGVTITARNEYPSIVMQQLDAKDIVKMPNIYSDVMRSVQILAGVSSNNELTSSYNVRGGNMDENLVYLNGYEIYRPMLLRQGIEENQSIINPDMVSNLHFSNGAFSALYGDKMSSALDVEYIRDTASRISANLRADLMNAGLTFRRGFQNGSVVAGGRFAYPKLFLGGLQTKGDYNPSFSDFQLFANYKPAENHLLELLFVYNYNKYDIKPKDWLGNFRSDRSTGPMESSAVEIIYHGSKYYSYTTGLAGLKYRYNITPGLAMMLSASQFVTKENEDGDINSEIFMYLNSADLTSDKDSIKTRTERNHNQIDLTSRQLKYAFNWNTQNNTMELGSEIKFVKLTNNVDEYYMENGKLALQTSPTIKVNNKSLNLNSTVFFINDILKLSQYFSAELGGRFLIYEYTSEKLFSPRGGVFYYPNKNNTISFNCGIYYQPPFFNEFNGEEIDFTKIKSQKSSHFVLGWEWTGKKNITFQAQLYYKNLTNLIPYYYDGLKLVYSKGNINEGYAYGMDLMVKGEVVKGIDSWIGYGYLDSKERKMNTNDSYKRRLFDQTHTLQVFLQDRIPNHPNWQSHFRFLAGSGFLYYNRKITQNSVTGQNEMSVNFDSPDEFLFYMRADMGLSYTHQYSNGMNLLVMVEVLNVFDKQNFAGYDFMMIFPDYKSSIKVPQVLSSRFFNVKLNLNI